MDANSPKRAPYLEYTDPQRRRLNIGFANGSPFIHTESDEAVRAGTTVMVEDYGTRVDVALLMIDFYASGNDRAGDLRVREQFAEYLRGKLEALWGREINAADWLNIARAALTNLPTALEAQPRFKKNTIGHATLLDGEVIPVFINEWGRAVEIMPAGQAARVFPSVEIINYTEAPAPGA